MKNLILLALLATALPSFAGKYQEIHTGKVAYEGQSADKIQKVIKKALIRRGWQVRSTEADHMIARINLRAHRADIKITWANGTITLAYQDSDNLGYRNKKGKELIHRNYNKWVVLLSDSIQRQFGVLSAADSG